VNTLLMTLLPHIVQANAYFLTLQTKLILQPNLYMLHLPTWSKIQRIKLPTQTSYCILYYWTENEMLVINL